MNDQAHSTPTEHHPTDADPRTATIHRDTNGDPLPAALVLSADDFAALGIDVQYEREVRYWVEDGRLRLGIGEEVYR